MKRIICWCLMAVAFLPAVWAGDVFPKVILSGDYPDPSVLRDGDDFYMTHSPFRLSPGFLIWHSRNLVDWEPVCRAVPEYEGSAMAPDLVKHDGHYYIYYPAAGTNWVSRADRIEGPWSAPVDLKVSGIDPGHVVGRDGKRYLFVNEGEVIQLADDGMSTVGEKVKVYDGWDYPRRWKTEGKFLESPKLTYHDGYYYLTSAEGGTAGPATSHMVVSARAKDIMGPWENSPYNPIVHTYSETDRWWSKGHGTLVDDARGNWWIVYHAYANGYHTLGRSTLIEPIEWTADGWFRTKETAEPAGVSGDVRHGMPLSDDFSKAELGLQWMYWNGYAPQAVNIRKGTLSLTAQGSTPADARVLMVTPEDKVYETQVEVTAGKGNHAGLMLYYSDKAYCGVVSDGKTFTVYRTAEQKTTVPNRIGKRFLVRILNRGNRATISVSKDGNTWTTLLEGCDVSQLNHNRYGGFYALRVALVSVGKGQAAFRDFRYRDAVPEEKDMAAYLMVFHQDATHGLHMAISRDGYTFTALNNGNPVIDGDTIADQRGIRDPHIFRGPDGAFYLSMTDLHVFGQRDGKRTTEWERDGKQYGWGNNRGLVLMKSWDLLNWTRTNIRFDELSAQFKEIGCAWAPEVNYDERAGKLMIYFTMRYGNEPNKLCYVYVNDDFNRIESEPQLLFQYPDETASAIDGDITQVGDKFHLFYVSHDGEAGIKHAVSDRMNGDYRFDARWYDFETHACEAPNVWKRIGEDKWVLMYDVYSINPHNFGFIETTDFVHFDHLGRFNEGKMKTEGFASPKHGAVIHLTKDEADRLETYWRAR